MDRVTRMELSIRGTPVTITAATVVLLLVGLGIAGYGGYDYLQQREAVDDAVSVESTVVDTEIDRSAGRGLHYRVTVNHTYRYNGTGYTSEQVFPGSIAPSYNVREDAEDVIDPYEPNETVTAYVDPDSPGRAFLERRATLAPLLFVGIGSLVLVLVTLDAVGAPTPGRGTELRPATGREPTRYETLFGRDRDAINRLSKRLIVGGPVVFLLSIVATVVLAFNAESSSIRAEVTDPIGLTLLTAAVAALVSVAAVLLYAVWSFTEYRRLRERIPEPRPPSPFRHPTRLVTILSTNDELDPYGRRVRWTGFAFAVIVFCVGLLVWIRPV